MSRYSVFLWLCILVSFVLPWLLATIFAWVYTEIYEKESSSGKEPESPALGYVTAVLHTSNFVVYIVFVCAALLCIGIVGRPDSHWAYCCLVLGIPVFCVVPVTAGSLALISAFGRGALIGRNIGITAAVLCFFSSLPCLCVLVCALTCGTRAKGKRSRYPVPLAYIPVLGEWPQRQDKWEKKRQQRKFTDDYPSDCPPGPIPDYKAVRVGSVDSGGVKSSSNSNGKLPSVHGVSVVKGNSDYTASRDHRKECALKAATILARHFRPHLFSKTHRPAPPPLLTKMARVKIRLDVTLNLPWARWLLLKKAIL